MPPQLTDRKSLARATAQGTSIPTPPKVPQRIPRQPSFANRFYLTGALHRPADLMFMIDALISIVGTVASLLFVEIPLLIWTGFKVNSKNHPVSWGPIYTFCMALSRASSSSPRNAAQLRAVSSIISWFVPIRMIHLSNYSVKANVHFQVHLETLLQPERRSLQETRSKLGIKDMGSNPLKPSPEYLSSFLPSGNRLANLPEESGNLESDGTYTLKGEWIEALDDPKDQSSGQKKKSNTVLLYFHGGGHVFCSSAFHRQMVTRLTLEFGPGARAFVPDYRLSPESPFPASIHDCYASYLYLTAPSHGALRLGSHDGHPSEVIDPKNIVLAGDSAGAGLAIALQLYLRDYVQPSVEQKLLLPPVTILISAWTDISTSMPSATGLHSYCYTPSPMGVNPFLDEATFYAFPKFNFARTYLCGDSSLAPNERVEGGKHLEWEWYRHLAQHPLVSPVYTANLSGLESSTLLQTGTFDRLADDTRLYAYKLGEANTNQRVRLELYEDMVHVHQFFEFLPMADRALRSIVDFADQAREETKQPLQRKNGLGSYSSRRKRETEWVVVAMDGSETEGHHDHGTPLSELDTYWRPSGASVQSY
ncbi:hypothetical protein EMPS_05354 [Entomortierella parvispora]|uniref:Alpha/beta hydrolase fold-3 domain-containing protein n=1 Tax=Entomortierella parvispora TaxID=205924 RepID=A0A9P3HA57_9FUNG|nr:hypothetical protein EMPS_05354 [Entomortierella parvispora]